MEQSIQFFSKKYDELLEKGKGFTNTISVKMKEQYDTEQEISAMKIRLTNMEKSLVMEDFRESLMSLFRPDMMPRN